MKTEQLLITIEEAADTLGLSRSFVYQLIDKGEIRRVHIGRAARISLAGLREFVERLDAGAVEVGS